MSLALKEAWTKQGLTYPNPAVGALICNKEGKILAIEATQRAGQAHAELQACISAFVQMGDTTIASLHDANAQHAYLLNNHHHKFEGCSLYVTLEPCHHQGRTPACSMLIEKLGFSKLICGTLDPNQQATGGINALRESGIDIETGILQEECETLLTPFRKWQNNTPFIFFKLALFANGVYDGGLITSKESRTYVHALRNNIDLLVIGGETVRVDRPTLDSRLVGGKAPDILIFSHEKEFDQTIPLFAVPGRKVFIEDNLDRIKSYRFVMIEGTQKMLEATQTLVDWYCIFYAPTIQTGKTIQFNKDLKRIQLLENKHDIIAWFQKAQ